MEQLDTPIGTKEQVRYSAQPVIVKNVEIVMVKRTDGKEVSEKVILEVNHPETDESVSISSVVYIKDKKIKQSALWFSLDESGEIKKWSALALLMGFYKIKTPKDFIGQTLETELDTRGYLVIKGY